MVIAVKILSKIACERGFEPEFGNGYGSIGSGTPPQPIKPSAEIFHLRRMMGDRKDKM